MVVEYIRYSVPVERAYEFADAYAYPEPDGFADHPVLPDAASYSPAAGQFQLPYEAVRTAADPDRTLLDFLQTTYEAAAQHGRWDRAALEDDPDRRAAPR